MNTAMSTNCKNLLTRVSVSIDVTDKQLLVLLKIFMLQFKITLKI